MAILLYFTDHNGIEGVELHIVDIIHKHPGSMSAAKLCEQEKLDNEA